MPLGSLKASGSSSSSAATARQHSDYHQNNESTPLLSHHQQPIGSPSTSILSRVTESRESSPAIFLPESNKLPSDRTSYWSYYIPALSWIKNYKRQYFIGDLVAGITVASYQIPVIMGYASSLALVPTVSGLYGLIIQPIVYSFLGCVPQMVVGPEAPISLVVGQAVTPYISKHKHSHGITEDLAPAEVAAIITAGSGAVLLSAGLFRFGFVDSVLSQALLRGFISAVGIVMIIDQLPSQLGLADMMKTVTGTHPSTIGKVMFVADYWRETHAHTLYVSSAAFISMAVMRFFKRKYQKKYRLLGFLPEILIVVVLSTIYSRVVDVTKDGLDIIGSIKQGKVTVEFPVTAEKVKDFKANFSASFFAAVLGFFESTIAAKMFEASHDITVSANRELIALGTANIAGSFVGALPSFGGFARSKINSSCGAKTPLSGIILALATAFSVTHLLQFFYYLPKCVLSSVITLVGISLQENVVDDIRFYWTVKGFEELITLAVTLCATIVWSVQTGIAAGAGFSLVRVIKHATYPRIQILGRVPGTSRFRNADTYPNILEAIEGCLIVKIPEPLTFANTGSLRNRLKRLERYGSMKVHPSQPRLVDSSMIHNLIIDLRGMSECDASAVKILSELVEEYVTRGVSVLFVHMPLDDTIRMRFRNSGIEGLVLSNKRQAYFDSIEKALAYVDLQ